MSDFEAFRAETRAGPERTTESGWTEFEIGVVMTRARVCQEPFGDANVQVDGRARHGAS
jgi:hypothetical protein